MVQEPVDGLAGHVLGISSSNPSVVGTCSLPPECAACWTFEVSACRIDLKCVVGLCLAGRLRVIPGGAVPVEPASSDPFVFQRECVEAFVASWRARGFSQVTIDNDAGLLERTSAALGRLAWEVTAEDIVRIGGELAVAGRSTTTRREYVQIFKGFHRFLQAARRPRSKRGLASSWCARSTSSTRLVMWATTRRRCCRRDTGTGRRVLRFHEVEDRDGTQVQSGGPRLCAVPHAVSQRLAVG